MKSQPLISVPELAARLGDALLTIVDCRFDLGDPAAGERTYREGHIPGAVYAHLDRDLADLNLKNAGRHPLPDAAHFCARLEQWGITPNHYVVAYDAGNGAFAARLWWLLRLLGHANVAVLDGGFAAWAAAGQPIDTIAPQPARGHYSGHFNQDRIADAGKVSTTLKSGGRVLDARAPERFRGDVEPLDSVAGHIPGAINRPFTANLTAEGRFKHPAELQAEFSALLGGVPASRAILMCGSGVTACHNLLAMEHAALPGASVYTGSWSEWITDPTRPVARG